MTLTQRILTIAVIVLGTMLTRFLPFLLFPAGKPTPKAVHYLGSVLPGAVFGLLVIYCLKNVSLLSGSHGIPDIGFGLVPGNYNSYVVDNIAAVTTADAVRAAQRVLRTDAIPASPSAGAALHAAARLIANGKSRSALAVFSARQNIL